MKTFLELQNFALRYFDEAEDTDTSRALVKDAIDAAHTSFLSGEKWPFMLSPELTLTAAGESVYTLSPLFQKPFYFWSTSENRPLAEVTDGNYVRARKDGVGDFALFGVSPVRVQPTVPGQLSIASSSGALETQSNGLFIRGEDAEGELLEETVLLSAPLSQNAFAKILSLHKVGTWNGTLTLTAGAPPQTLVKLTAAQNGKQYPQIEFLRPTVDTISYRFFRKPVPLVEDEDLTDFPEGYELWAAYDALLSLATYNAVESSAVPTWIAQRKRLEDGMREMQLPQARGALPSYISYIERD
jgi:hypothetical protein